MTDLTQCHNELQEILQQEADCLGQLKALLDEEHQALETRDGSALPELASKKEAALTEEAELSQKRAEIMQQHGFDNNEAGMEKCLETADEGLSRLWQQLQTLLSECQDQNAVNGYILEVQYQNTKQVLSLLSQDPQKLELYNPRGTTHSGKSSNTIAKA